MFRIIAASILRDSKQIEFYFADARNHLLAADAIKKI